MDDLEPNTKKAWKKMKKRFKGGMGPGIWGGVGAGIMYIMIPLVPLIIIPMLVPSDFDMKEAPEFIQTLFTKLWAIPLMLGWFMVLAGFFKKYYRRGSPQRAISFVSFSAGKALYMYAFFAPFIISISIGDGGMDLDYRGYFTILYSLIALGALYSVFECIALRKDLDSYYNGIIPIEYYPRKYRKEVPPPPAPPGDQAPPPIPPGTPLPPPASPEDPTYSLPPPPAPDPQYSPPPDQGAPPSYPPPQDQEMPPSYSPPPDQ
ncbi:MAG: hypothetical protein KAT70_01225 [Thermoplasmata archaeon]|nr:hypothetical protein [Thermoplasmata archaeon]